jgi:hypothetical protein
MSTTKVKQRREKAIKSHQRMNKFKPQVNKGKEEKWKMYLIKKQKLTAQRHKTQKRRAQRINLIQVKV